MNMPIISSYQSISYNMKIKVECINLIEYKIIMSEQKEKRRLAINRAKQSISKLPIISRNVNMVNEKIKRLSSTCTIQNEPKSTMSITLERGESKPLAYVDTFNEKYKMGKKIGEGSSGYVHECLHLRRNKIYACKSMMFDDEHVPLLKKNFMDIRQLDHPNIVKYKALYIDLQKHLAHLVMEFVNLPSLMDYIENLAQPVQENEIKWIFQQLFETLQYMHSKGISHRDIKPDNIMIDEKHKKIKIIDFGIAKKMISRKQKIDMLTITGTLFYRAPQMFIGGGYNQKVDIWAAGITLYQVLHGKTPFASQYHSQTIENIQNMQLESQGDFNTGVSDVLKNLLIRLLRKDPNERFSAEQALDHLWFDTKVIKLHKRLSDVGHIVQTQYQKCKRKIVQYDPSMFKHCKQDYQVKKFNSLSYHRIEVDDF